MIGSFDHLISWAILIMGGMIILHVATAQVTGTINYDGDWIDQKQQPKAFRWATWAEYGLGGFLVVISLIMLI